MDENTSSDLQTRLLNSENPIVPIAIASPTSYAEEGGNESDNNNNNDDARFTRGEMQASRFRDLPFAMLFLLQLGLVVFFAFAWGVPTLRSGFDSGTGTGSIGNHGISIDTKDKEILKLFGYINVTSLSISGFGLYLLTRSKLTEVIIESSFAFSIGSSLLFGILFSVKGLLPVAILFYISFLVTSCYFYCIYSRIPFAAANVATAVTAIRSNCGILFLVFLMAIKLTLWLIIWLLAVMGVYYRQYHCSDDSEVCTSNMSAAQISLFLLSFYWTNQVLANIIHVTVAGVLGTWWFSPTEASSCCSKSITDSFCRSVTYSFGSICLGSLVVAIIQLMKHLVNQLRNNRRGAAGSLVLCVLECVMGCLQSIIEYFNKWAFVYVGIYGYDYATAGRKVITLFRAQGWTNIINDQLVYRTFLILNIIIAAITGVAGMTIAAMNPSLIQDNSHGIDKSSAWGIVFVSSFFIGFAMANVLTSVIASAVDTVIVCFAEAPEDFRDNYPELHQKMENAWRKIYPDEYEYAAVPIEPPTGNEHNI